MAYSEQQLTNIFKPVENIALQIHNFTRQQKIRLLQLVPELRTIPTEETDIPPEQLELIAYFQKQVDALPENRPMPDDAIFMRDVTVGEFFALPEREQAHLWEEAHREAEKELGYDDIEED